MTSGAFNHLPVKGILWFAVVGVIIGALAAAGLAGAVLYLLVRGFMSTLS